MKKSFSLLIVGALIASASAPARAGGWIADNIIKPIAGKHAANEADKVHEKLNKPLDQVAKAAADAAAAAAAAAAATAIAGGNSK